ncbi:hypothetical protein KI688_007539 [Linnemannia hyalina]|uniref:Uncharacterized protein n=1 Tax=Linnemannia hyalina TaxID=64524 RepID=A0A9P7XKL9_9FUNG|nr:hypothetical protein KI688_007539 [Linnemannia hyalina]
MVNGRICAMPIEEVTQIYENLIESTRLKQARRSKPNKQYTIFSTQKLDDYWTTRMLEFEWGKTRVRSAMIATRTARLTQDMSLYESPLEFHSNQA